MPDDDSSELTRADFIVQYLNDLARGELRALDEYYQRYPGFEDVIASEWRRLQEARLAGGITPPPPESDSAETAPGAPRQPPEPTRVTSLGRYRIERELGRGVQGTVFRAWDTS